MLESAVELLGGLFVSALLLLIAFCVIGSTVAALRAVRRAAVSGKRGREEITVAQESPRTGESCAPPRWRQKIQREAQVNDR
jgi:hypothetical protein